MDVRDEAKPIPDDIMAKAREVWKSILDDPRSNSNGVVFGHIARALLAERERATLAERERASREHLAVRG